MYPGLQLPAYDFHDYFLEPIAGRQLYPQPLCPSTWGRICTTDHENLRQVCSMRPTRTLCGSHCLCSTFCLPLGETSIKEGGGAIKIHLRRVPGKGLALRSLLAALASSLVRACGCRASQASLYALCHMKQALCQSPHVHKGRWNCPRKTSYQGAVSDKVAACWRGSGI